MFQFLAPFAVFACPIGMGAMLWIMMRGQGDSTPSGSPHNESELATLRARIDQLQAEQRDGPLRGARDR